MFYLYNKLAPYRSRFLPSFDFFVRRLALPTQTKQLTPSLNLRTYATSSSVPPQVAQKILAQQKRTPLTRAHDHIKAERYTAAIDTLKTIAKKDPDYKTAQTLLLSHLNDLKRYVEAKAVVQSLLKEEPDNRDYHIALGMVLFNLGELENAAACLSKIKLQIIQEIRAHVTLRDKIPDSLNSQLEAISHQNIPEKFKNLFEIYVEHFIVSHSNSIEKVDAPKLRAVTEANAINIIRNLILKDFATLLPLEITMQLKIIDAVLPEIYSTMVQQLDINAKKDLPIKPDDSKASLTP